MFKTLAAGVVAFFVLATLPGCAKFHDLIYGEAESAQQRAYRGAAIALGANKLFARHCLVDLDAAAFDAAAGMRAAADSGGDIDKAGKTLKRKLLLYAGRADVAFAADLGFSGALDLSLAAIGKKVLKAGGKVAKRILEVRERVNDIFEQGRDPTAGEWAQLDADIAGARAALNVNCG